MISRIIISGYRRFRSFDMEPGAGLNIMVGDNEAGKSTLLEAINMALTGRVNGRWMQDELNPYWFNLGIVREFYDAVDSGLRPSPPEILIELYLQSDEADLQRMRGVYNSRGEDSPGVAVRIKPADDFAFEFSEYLSSSGRPAIIPVEYYETDWRDFRDEKLTRRPKGLGVSVIDSRTIRSTSGVDHHTREMLGDYVEPKERAAIAVAHRRARHAISEQTLTTVNARIAAEPSSIHERNVGLDMDQSANASWESGIVPKVGDVPFALAGQGQQAAIKVALAMNRRTESTSYVLVEEPENHQSHTSLTRLIARIERLAGQRQLFLTTHSSYVLNRLGLDKLRLLSGGKSTSFSQLTPETVRYFQRLSGYGTLRLVLAEKIVLVEGPSDEIVFARAFQDANSRPPIDRGVDVVSMDGVALGRGLELCAALGRKAAAVRDNDGKDPEHWRGRLARFLKEGDRELFVGSVSNGKTLELQLLDANGDNTLRTILGYTGDSAVDEWMINNKTESALRIAEAEIAIKYPQYILDAIGFVM